MPDIFQHWGISKAAFPSLRLSYMRSPRPSSWHSSCDKKSKVTLSVSLIMFFRIFYNKILTGYGSVTLFPFPCREICMNVSVRPSAAYPKQKTVSPRAAFSLILCNTENNFSNGGPYWTCDEATEACFHHTAPTGSVHCWPQKHGDLCPSGLDGGWAKRKTLPRLWVGRGKGGPAALGALLCLD